MYTVIRDLKERDERGFTLIELLIVIAIIAILAVIAIPQFAAYRQRAIRASMVADARNAATLEEAIFSDDTQYDNIASTTYPNTDTIGTSDPQTVRPSSGNTISSTGAPTSYIIVVTNANAGTGSTNYSMVSDGNHGWY